MTLNLDEIRTQIDAIDTDLVQLIEERMKLVTQVAAYKKETGKAVLDTKREEAVLAKVASRVKDPDYTDTIVATFSDIMANSRAYQKKTLGL